MRYAVRRLVFYAVTAWAAVTVNFILPRLIPGDPVQSLIARYKGQLSGTATQSLYALFGLNKNRSLWQQYGDYWGQLAHGNLGTSFTFFPTPVISVIGSSLPWTVALVGIATVISFVLGTAAGVLAGWKRGGWAERLIPVVGFFSSVPYFWFALLILALFAVKFQVFPDSGGYAVQYDPGWNAPFLRSVLYYGVLPATTIVVSSFAGWMLGMRNMMVTVTSEDYVLVGHAKGLPESRVRLRYAARNALLPNISGFALSLGFIVGGTLLTELVFSYPGIGYVMYQAVNAKDYPLMQGIFLVVTFSVLLANLVADMVYVLLDPRIRSQR